MMRLFLVLFSISLFTSSCKEKLEVLPSASEVVIPSGTQIFTRTYTVKQENGIWVKDSIRKIESVTIDATGQELEKQLYTLDGKIYNSEVYSYNEAGHKMGAELFKDGEIPTAYFKYTLDEQGRVIEQVLYNKVNDAKIMQLFMRYQEDGKVRQHGAMDDNGTFVPTDEFIFDDNGTELGYNIIQPYTSNRAVYRFKYTKFNEAGEWTEREAIKDGVVQAIFVRNFVEKEF